MNDAAPPKRFVPIRMKLLAATIISGLLAVLIALAGLYCMQLLNQRLREVVDVAAQRVKLTNLLRQDLSSVRQLEQNLIRVTGKKEFDRIATTMDTRLQSIDEHVSRLRPLLDAGHRQLLAAFVDQLTRWRENHEKLRRYSGMDTQRQARELSLTEGESAFNRFEAVINQMTARPPDTGDPTAVPDEPPSATRDVKLKLLAELRRDALKLQRVEKNLILQASIATTQTPEEAIGPFRDQVQRRLAALEKVLDEREKEYLRQARSHLDEYLRVNEQIADVVQQKGDAFGFQEVRDNGARMAEECDRIANAMVVKSEKSLDEYESESVALYRVFRNSLLALSLVAVLVSVVVSISAGNRVSANLRKLSGYAREVRRARDLSRPVPKVSNDEIGELAEAFDEMRVSLLRQSSQLANLNETLEHKNEEMEQFVYSVSHDLKSPLVSCKGLVGLINEDIRDGDFEEVGNSAARLSTVTDQMSDTIDDLLTFSRLGRHKLEMTRVDVLALVRQIGEEWEERARAAAVAIQVNPDLLPVHADPISLRRVFDNLIGNAVKYAGDVENAMVEIGSDRKGNRVRYYVRDNGPGIEPRYHEKIFGLFQRLDTSKTGTGIGLASVAKIMRLHRGRIWVDSRPAAGATFWIEFPD